MGSTAGVAAAAAAGVAVALALGGCRPLARPLAPPAAPPTVLTPLAHPPQLHDEGDLAALAAAVRASLAYLARLPADRPLAFGQDQVSVGALTASLESLLTLLATRPTPEALAAELERRFVVYRAAPPGGVLFTGYHVPTLQARLASDRRFRLPLRARPRDLVTVALDALGSPCGCREQLAGRVVGGRLEPYYTRAQIENGAGANAPALAWVDDPIALFFLQIQGSGVLLLPDGTRRMVGFAASNGHPYVSVGKLLVDSGRLALSDASADGIRRYLAAHPDERDATLRANPRYVFFRWLDGPAVGSLGVPVVARRAIATDPTVYPPGALVFIRVPNDGVTVGASADTFAGLALNLDAGAAIRGPGRVDLFLGEGPEAASVASRLKAKGELYLLAPRTAAQTRASARLPLTP